LKARYSLLFVAAVFQVSCAQSGEDAVSLSQVDNAIALAKSDAHAKEVYGQYQAASGGQISFELSTLQTGRVSDVLDQPVQSLVDVPDFWITMQSQGTEIANVRREARDPTTDEWAKSVLLSKFDELGRSTDAATYQLLSVRTQLGGEVTDHRALQVCWAAEGYCLVMDPAVQNLEGFAGDRARLLAEGWKVDSAFEGAAIPSGEVGVMSVCSLNSNHAWGGLSYTWSARTVTYKNLYGITVVEKNLAGQKVQISCYISGSSCLAAASGYSWASSCWANLGFNCDCDYTGNQAGTSSNAARAWSESKCSHKNVFEGTANVGWSRSGVGANFTISWSSSGGSVDAIGGTYYDSCAWH